MGRVRQWSGKPGFNPRSSHTKDSKMVLDVTLLNTQHYKVRIKGRVKQSGKPGFNPRSNHTTDSKMVLDVTLLNTQHYKVRIKSKVKQSREWSRALPNTSVF